MVAGQLSGAFTATQAILVATYSKERKIAVSVEESKPPSPTWSSTFKIIIGLIIAGLVFALLIYFRSIIGPLILAFILIYLLHPLVELLTNHTKLSWRMSVNIVYFSLLIIVIGLFTLTGLAAFQQIVSLIGQIESFVNDLPNLIDNLSRQAIIIGPYSINLSQFTNLGQFSTQVIGALQTIIGRAGTLAGTLATATASTVGWMSFIMIISYFVLADSGKVPSIVDYLDIPGYRSDIQRLSAAMGRIWNAFLRGQITIVIMVIISYTILLSILGVRYAFALAIIAGLARFVPYVGPIIVYIIMALVTLFQGGNYFHLVPIYYTVITIGLSILVDQSYDNLVSPRIMGRSLGVHPAAVLVVALIAFNLIGVIGLMLAAPVLASITLLARYTFNKMVDRDPWANYKEVLEPMGFHWFARLFNRLIDWWNSRKQNTA
jgi:predicted PurR-regulated permease PerM